MEGNLILIAPVTGHCLLHTLAKTHFSSERNFILFNTKSLHSHVVCNVPVFCKANGVGKHLGAWRVNYFIVVHVCCINIGNHYLIITTPY